MNDRITDYVLLLLLAVIWSTSFLLIKVGIETIPPFTLTAVRMSISALIFGLYLMLKGQWIPMHPQALLLYFVSGVVGNSVPFVLISWGEVHISSSLTAILMGIMPISTFVLAHYFVSEEPMTRRKSAGVFFGFCGLIALVGLPALLGLGDHILGQLAVLGGALGYAIVTIFVRRQPYFTRYKMAAGANIAAALVSIPLAFLFESPVQVTPSLASVWATLALAIFPTAIASLIYFRVVKHLGATTFSQINYAIPVLGSLWGVLVLDEMLRWNTFIAMFLVLCGVYFIQTQPATKPNG